MNQILDGLIILISISLSTKSFNDAMIGIDFQMLLGSHVSHGGSIPEGLSLHNPFHVGSPTVLRSDNATGRVDQTVGHDDLFDLKHEKVEN